MCVCVCVCDCMYGREIMRVYEPVCVCASAFMLVCVCVCFTVHLCLCAYFYVCVYERMYELPRCNNACVLVYACVGARGVIVIVVGNEHGDTGSNPGRNSLHFT